MKVYIVSQDTKNEIGVTSCDIPSVINFLVDKHWLKDTTQIWCDKFDQWISVRVYFGEHWYDVMLTWDRFTFDFYFNKVFYIEEYEVYGL